jgi:hypothetical protein
MKRLTLLGCALFVTVGSVAQAQSSGKDAAAWSGLMLSPAGAFPAIETSAGGRTDGARQLAIRVSSWSFKDSDVRQNNYGISFLAPATSKVRYSGTVGWSQPSGDTGGDNDGLILLGGDIASALWESPASAGGNTSFSLDWKASMGLGHFTGEGGGNAWSLALQVPFKFMYKMASKSDLSAYVNAGFALAGVSDDTDSETGTRPMYGLGGAWTSAGGVGIHLGAQRIPLDFGIIDIDPPWVGSLAVSFPVGGKK